MFSGQPEALSLVEILRARARQAPGRLVYTFLGPDGNEVASLTHAGLYERARAVALALASLDARGEPALLLYPPGLDFIAAFFGCLLAGTVAVPAYPPRPRRPEERLRSIAADARPRVVLGPAAILREREALAGLVPELAGAAWLATDGLPAPPPADIPEVSPAAADPAFLQYTSGSTADPKGVVITHGNLLHNAEAIRRAFGQSEASVVVGWLPLYHDMGLIGNVLQPLYAGGRAVLMSPVSFLQRPRRWLEAISRYRATTSGGPNFAYDLCVQKIGEAERRGLDLSSWSMAFNGAEPVRAETLERFAAAFAPCGFRREALYPCYGLAEATLFVTGGMAGEAPVTLTVRAADLEQGRAVPAGPGTTAERVLVGCGRSGLDPGMDQVVRIVDPESRRPCPAGQVGEIWIAGPSVAAGYRGRPEADESVFQARLADPAPGEDTPEDGARCFLRTGDLGFAHDGTLFITGRRKDLIILRGRNHYPQDLERTAERAHAAVRPGGTAAFAVEEEGGERLVLVCEVDRRREEIAEEVAGAVRQALAEEHEVAASDVVLLRAGTLPKTSSGKVRRGACRTLYLEGGLAAVGRSGPVPPAMAMRPDAAARAELALAAWQRAGDAPEEERLRLAGAFLRATAARLLRLAPDTLEMDRPLSAYGLDSLAAAELQSAAEAGLGAAPPLSALLGGMTLTEAARQSLAAAPLPASPEPPEALEPAGTELGETPLSHGQRALWLLHGLAPESAACHLAAAVRIVRGGEPERLRQAFQTLADRHPALRTTCAPGPAGEDAPVQRVHGRSPVAFVCVDAGSWSDETLGRRLREEAFRPFDLERGPLFRAALFTRAAEPPLLAVAAHHLVADFASFAVLARELASLYGAGALPAPPPFSYADYVHWQARRVAGPAGERLWEHWRERLAGAPPLDLATDRPRPPVQTFRGAARTVRLGPAAALHGLARRQGATPFVVLLAAFQALLGRYSGQDDFLVGSPTSGRRPLGMPAGMGDRLEGLVGYFASPVALRAGLSGDPTVAALVARTAATVLDALAHADYPLALLAERLQALAGGRDPSRPALFQTMLAWQRAPVPELAGLAALALGEGGARLDLGDLALESVPLAAAGAQLELTLMAAELDGELAACLQWNRDLFDAGTAGRLLAYLGNLLRAMAADPARRLAELDLLGEDERRQVLGAWGRSADLPARLAAAAGLGGLFATQAARTPGATALIHGHERLTYGELAARAGRLAHRLRRLGVGPEAPVGVFAARTPAMVTALLAVLQAGGAYVPLDPAYPRERLAFLLADSAAPLVLAEERLAASLPGFAGRLVLLEEDDEEEREAVPCPCLPEQTAYLIYTSGSTGLPKGVAVRHGGAMARIAWAAAAYPAERLRGVLAATSICFDLSVFELFVPLSLGGAVVLADDVLALPGLPAAGEVTLLNTVPSAMAELLRSGGVPSSVRTVNLAGEPLRRELAAGLYALPFIEEVWNLYGPSEDTTYSTGALVRRADLAAGRAPTIGRPLPGSRARVLDAGLQPLPVGVPGELWLGGEGLARGYHGRPGLTADRFRPDPFAGPDGAGGRLYRTGDRARWLHGGELDSGELEFLGRRDGQVKVRGFRIELGEVEAALAACPAVAEVAVGVWEPDGGTRQLAAWIVPAPGAGADAAALRTRLREILPEPMVPAAWSFLPALPRTPNGKLDRRALPAPGEARSGAPFAPPRTPAEETLAAVWARALGRERVGVDDDFFELGGDSILGMRIVALAAEQGLRLLPRQLFQHSTVARLAAVAVPVGLPGAVPVAGEGVWKGGVDARNPHPLAPSPTPSRQPGEGGIQEGGEGSAGDVESIDPLSPVQEGILFHTLLEPERGLYLLQLACVLRGELDPPRLRRAWESAVERNPALRTAFRWQGVATPVQVVSRRAPLPWTELDWRDLSAAGGETRREAQWAGLCRADLEQGFDLGRQPLLRLTLVRTAADEHRLLWTSHHILLDGWCLPLLLEEVFTLYAGLAAPERRRPYRDYIAWLQGRDAAASEQFWRDSLAGIAAPTPLGVDLSAGLPAGHAPAAGEHAEQGLDLAAGATAALAAMARRHGLTLHTVVQGAWALLLSRYAGEPDVVFGSAVSGRSAPLPGIEEMIGLFVNNLPVRVRVPATAPLVPWLRELQDRHARLLEHEHSALVQVQEWSGVPRGLPLFESVVAFQSFPRQRLLERSVAGLPLGVELERSVDRVHYPLALFVFGGDRLALRLHWDTGRFSAVAVTRLLGHLEALLTAMAAAMAADSVRRLSDLSPLTGAERHQLLREWNDTAEEPAGGRALHELFEARAAAAPDAIALVAGSAGGLSWSYGQLDEQAGRLAGHLLALGLRPGEMVALKLSRGFDLVRAPLAVLKAGGAYVPLDSGFPEARVRWILDALRVRFLVTDDPRFAGGFDGLPDLRHVVNLGNGWEEGRWEAPAAPRRAGPDDLAYVIFTSGSTGVPKGVVVRHRPVVNVVEWVNRTFAVGPADRVLFITSLGFDLSVYDVFGLLAAGGSVQVATEEDLAEPGRLVDLLASEPVTLWDSAPAALQQLVPLFPRLPAAGLRGPRGLRLVFLSGDWIPLPLPGEVRGAFPGARVIALGGATEAVIWSNSFAVEEVDPAWPSIPYGRPIGNARYHVLDEGLSPCPIGVAGDLYIGGGCLAAGYAGDAALTAGKFVPDPWSGTPGGVLYRTGDRARHLADGNLQFLGRLDQQVKIRGFRIELGEVEAQLATHPEVREALAVVREDRPGERRLVAYVVASRPLGAAAVRDYLRQRLPAPMVPAAVVELAALPVTPNGKVDRKALPCPEVPETEPAGSSASAAPRGPIEELLAGIWGELLGRDRIDAGSHFFELGGHSLLATQLVSRVREAFGLTLPLRLLFEAPTVGGLAAELEALLRRERGLAAPPLLPVARGGDLPLSFAQERLWFFDRLRPGSALYNLPLALELEGDLAVAALAASLAAVAARHEALRTVFAAAGGDGRPVQVVRAAAGLALPVVDLAGLPAGPRRDEAARLAAAEVARPFDLARGPLARAALLRLAAGRSTLLLTLHHIVADGWSLGVLVREVGELYGALVEARAPRLRELPELPVQYADFAVWQRAWLSGDVLAAQLAHWREHLAGAPPVTPLPLDRPRPAVQSYRGARVPFLLPGELGRRLAALARTRGATLFMGLSAVFAALLGRLTGEDDLVVGSPVAARNWRETEGLIGFFVNFLPWRAGLADDPGFAVLLARLRETALEAYAHQDLPFERLVEELQPERSLAFAPLFQVQLVLQNAPLGDPALPGLTARPVEADLGSARFDLTLSLAETAAGLAGYWEHATDLLDGATVARMAGHFTQLLAAALARPEARLSELPLLAAGERHQLLAEWAEGPMPAMPAMPAMSATLPELVAAQARRRPDAVALAGDELAVTYGELERQSYRLARHLAGLGVGPGVPVGLCLERTPRAVAAILGTLAAGGVYVPLDPGHPAERLAAVIEDAGIVVLLTEEALAASLPPFWGVTVALDTDHAALARESAEPFAPGDEPGAGLDGLAYVLYTSGSTGRPKGVAVPHRGLAGLCAAQARLFEIGAESRVFQFAALGFDASVSEIAVTLAAGGTLVLPPGGELLPGPGLAALLREREITAVTLPPSALAVLPREAAAGLPALATLVVAGEACPVDLARCWALPGRRLVNAYGPTETTVCATAALYAGGEVLPLGRPIDGAGVFLLDRRGHLVPPGATGELCVAGPGLARGYLGLPERTAESFVPHPFATVATGATGAGERLYRTGDLARHRPDGELELRGRADHQVKVRGVRIEPGEIEAALLRCRGVREAAVLVRDDLPGGRGLVAWVAAEEGTGLAAAELRDGLRRVLPEALVPAHFGFLEHLPRTSSSGKLDRRALARAQPTDGLSVDPAGSRAAARRTPPRGPAEELLAGIFAAVLGVDEVGAEESFFDLGGHSLLATQVLSRVQAAFGAEVPLALLFEKPTVAGLAAALAARLHGPAAPAAAPPLRPAPREAPPPLSFAQERLWFLDRLRPGSPLYNLPHAFELRGALSWPALAAALSGVAARHEALRTTFAVPPGGAAPVQVIAPSLLVAPPVADLQGLPAARREAEAEALAAAEAGRPFDLARGPLVRAFLVRLAADRHVALLTLHHGVSDGWSVGVLVRELAELYGASRDGRRAALPSLPVQYADFALWQRQWLSGAKLEAEIAWWAERLSGAPPALALPFDRPAGWQNGGAARSDRGGELPVRLPAALSRALAALARTSGATLFMVLLAAFQALLARISGQEDLVVGTPVANRNRLETEGLIGFFVNTLALRGDLGGDPAFGELVARARTATLAAHAHQGLPFERLVEALRPERNPAVSPLFQVLLALQNAPAGELALPGLTLAPLAVARGTAKFDLTLSLSDTADGLAGAWEHAADRFDAATVARLAGHFATLLTAAAARPETPLSALPLLAAAELHQLLVEWNDTAREVPRQSPVDALFELRADRCPDALAISFDVSFDVPFGTEELSYRGLDERANRLARHLRRHGVATGDCVGVCLERSAATVVALLAVLKAGGAYLPLDPDDPRERLAFLLADAGVPVLLTRRGLRDRLPAEGPRVICLDGDGEAIGRESAARLAPDERGAAGESPAYVIYTSGSTGTPKGVAVPHRGVVRLVMETDYVHLGEGDRVAQASTVSFDAATFEIWGALLQGAALVGISRETLLSPRELAAVLRERRVTTLFLTTALFNQVAREAPSAFATLRDLLFGGEAVDPEAVRRVLASGPPERLLHVYGPTESTTFASWHRVREVPAGAWTVPIGRPVVNTRIHVLDPHLRPVPVGVAGELCIGGDGLALGYLGLPERTGERFVASPELHGERLYRTGDRVRRLAGGSLEFLGRTDHQVKLRGFRIELGEVEAVLAAQAGVRDAAVVVREGPEGERSLMACVVPAGGEEPAALAASLRDRLRDGLRQRLSAPMVPSRFVFVDALPLTPSGKVDRQALSRLEPERAAGSSPALRRGPITELLAALFASLLGVERVGAEESFFELGGHSLLATRLVSRVREALGVELPIAVVFETPSAAGLAGWIEQATREAVPPIAPVPRDGALPLSFTQERLWFLHRLDPGSAAYNMPLAARLSGPLRPRALAAALTEIVRRHEVLRTVYVEGDAGRAGQLVLPAAPVPLPLVDLGALPAAAGREEARRLAVEEARRPFDLARGPVLRAALIILGGLPGLDGLDGCLEGRSRSVEPSPPGPLSHPLPPTGRGGKGGLEGRGRPSPGRRGGGGRGDGGEGSGGHGLPGREHLLLLTLHHIAGDGWSVGVFGRELEALYGSGDAGAAGDGGLPPLPVQYADFAVWQRRWLTGAVLAERLASWRERLAGAPPLLELPAERPRPEVQRFRGAAWTAALPADLVFGLRRLGAASGVTLFMVLLAAWKALFLRYTGQEDVVLGAPIAGRTRGETERLVGCFLNTLALRTRLAGDPPFQELLERVREVTLAAYTHQDLPFELLLQELRPERSLAYTPVFQVMLNGLEPETGGAGGSGALRLRGLAVEPETPPAPIARFDLEIYVIERAGSITLELVYDRDLFGAAQMAQMAGHLESLLAAVAADPGRRLSGITLSPAASPRSRPPIRSGWRCRWRARP